MGANWMLAGPAVMARGLAALVVGLVLGLLSSGAQAYALSFLPAVQSVALGRQASVVLQVDGVQPAGLGAYDFEVGFDPAVLSFNRAIDARGLGVAIGLQATPGAGTVVLSDFSLESLADLLALQGDKFDLLTLVFNTVAPGTSALTLSGIALGDAEGNPVEFVAEAGRITVEAGQIPEPGSAALAALGLIVGLAGLRRRSAAIAHRLR